MARDTASLQLTDLPNEILSLIINYVRENVGLRNLCKMSRKLRHISTPLLYERIRILPTADIRRLEQLFTQSNPGLPYIRSLQICARSGSDLSLRNAVIVAISATPQDQLSDCRITGLHGLDRLVILMLLRKQTRLRSLRLDVRRDTAGLMDILYQIRSLPETLEHLSINILNNAMHDLDLTETLGLDPATNLRALRSLKSLQITGLLPLSPNNPPMVQLDALQLERLYVPGPSWGIGLTDMTNLRHLTLDDTVQATDYEDLADITRKKTLILSDLSCNIDRTSAPWFFEILRTVTGLSSLIIEYRMDRAVDDDDFDLADLSAQGQTLESLELSIVAQTSMTGAIKGAEIADQFEDIAPEMVCLKYMSWALPYNIMDPDGEDAICGVTAASVGSYVNQQRSSLTRTR